MRDRSKQGILFFSMIPLTAPFLSLDVRSLFFRRESLFSRLCERVARAYSLSTTKPSRGGTEERAPSRRMERLQAGSSADRRVKLVEGAYLCKGSAGGVGGQAGGLESGHIFGGRGQWGTFLPNYGSVCCRAYRRHFLIVFFMFLL